MYRKNDLIIIIPTYNEVGNIENIVKRIYDVLKEINFKILFVDDNSSDGTIERIQQIKKEYKFVDLIVRTNVKGLASACIDGFINSDADFIAVMDCDLQHDEKILPKMWEKLTNNDNLDLIVGSRHTEKGSAKSGFSFLRNFLSKIAIKFTNLLLIINVKDPMSGYFMIRKNKLTPIISKLQPNGFKILADIIASSKGDLSIMEIGYDFKKRQSGESKMSLIVAIELFALILSHLSYSLLSIRFILFAMVGASGIFVQILSTYILFKLLSISFLNSQILSVFIAMTSNYYFNNIITYKDRALLGKNYLKGLFSFYLICSIGALANVAFADFVYKNLEIWVVASILGALLGAIWNFIINSTFTWKIK